MSAGTVNSASLAQLYGGFCHVQFVTAKATVPRIRHSEMKHEERAVRLLAAPHSQPRLQAHSCPSPSASCLPTPLWGTSGQCWGTLHPPLGHWPCLFLLQNPPPAEAASALLPHAHMLPITQRFQSSPITPALTAPRSPQSHTSLLPMHTCP